MKEEKALLRSVMRLLHPDLFSAYPTEQEINASALKKLNHYLDELALHTRPEPISLRFWIKKESGLEEIATRLESDGLLAPLYHALGLISNQEYLQWTAEAPDHQMDEDLLDWLKNFVGKVVEDGERHAVLKTKLIHTKAKMEAAYRLKSLHMGSEFNIGVTDLKIQLELLELLDDAMKQLTYEVPQFFANLSLCVHQPGSTSLHLTTQRDPPSSWISDDGCLHLVVKPDKISRTLQGLDLDRAGLLTRLHSFWERRADELRDSMKDLFQVEDILCDISTGSNAQQFVLWAGSILANRDEVGKRLAGRPLPLMLLVHSDDSAPMVDYSAASSTLHVRTDCSHMHLLNYVQSDRCLNAKDEAREMLTDDLEEQRVLEEARKALGAKHVIRICSVYERQQAIKAAERLIENAESIRRSVDLSDAGIAIDSNYQAWESGFISIPYNYRITDLKPNLRKLIGEGKAKPHHPPSPHRSNGHIPTAGYLRSAVPKRRHIPRTFHARRFARSPILRFV